MIGTALMQSSASADTVVDSNHVQVVSGDTLSKIAQEHGTTVSQLAQDNNISNVDLIHVGDVIAVTPGSESSESTNQQATASVASQATNTNINTDTTANTNTVSQPVSNNYNSSNATGGNSTVHDQFINAGGTEAMWNAIVMPESGGNPNATNGQYSGLGQTNQSWGTGTVAQQTQGMIDYANSRYGSISNAISFRASNGWW